MELPAPFSLDAHGQIAIALGDSATAVFTTRRGGLSAGPYATLNLGFLTDDDPAAVVENRRRLQARYGVALAWGRQVHGTTVETRTAGNVVEGVDGATESDAQVTAVAGVGPMVLTADCLGIAIASGGAVAAVHAGWRGLAHDVIGAAVARVRSLSDGAGSPILHAAIGPGAGPCCYEVGDEVHAEFAAYGDRARRGRNLDMKAIAAAQLRAAGVGTIHDVGLCTICGAPDLFYSHRRDHGVTGRQAAIAWLS